MNMLELSSSVGISMTQVIDRMDEVSLSEE